MIIKELSFRRDQFSVETTRPSQTSLSVILEGSADLRVQSEFTSLIHKLHEEAIRSRVASVRVDMDKLEFLSSGCFKGLCTWVRLLLERHSTYSLCIRSNPKHHWQVRSLSALQLLAPDLIGVEKSEPSGSPAG